MKGVVFEFIVQLLLIMVRMLREDQPLRLLLNFLFYDFNHSEPTYKFQRIKLPDVTGTGFYKVLARDFTISPKLGFIPHVWKAAVLLCSLSQTNRLHKLLVINPLVYLVQ